MPVPVARGVWIALAVAALAAGVAGCSSVPAWTGLRLPPSSEPLGPVTYPDLSNIPDRPQTLTSAADRQAIMASLLADRARNAQAADSLRREVETNFVVPEPPAGL
jgi:hypothetical protein